MEEENKTGKDQEPSKKTAFVTIDGLRFEKTPHGLIFSPEYNEAHRKHHCSDCMTCAWCSDPRCALCRVEAKDMKNEQDRRCQKNLADGTRKLRKRGRF